MWKIKKKPQQQQTGPWFMDSCHLRHFLLWQPMNVAPDEGSGYISLWIYFLELLLSSPSAFTLCSCYYPKPYRSGFCLLEWHGLMFSSPQDSFALLAEPLQYLTSSGSQRHNVLHLWAVEGTIGTQGWHGHLGNSDTGSPSHSPLFFVTLYPQSP